MKSDVMSEVNANRSTESWRVLARLLVFAVTVWVSFLFGYWYEMWAHSHVGKEGRMALLFQDFAQLNAYRTENRALALDSHRVVFFGDSITYQWDLSESFPGEPYLNRGLGGQTTSQMVLRFRQDVLDLHPASVIIMGGTNDMGDTSSAPMQLAVTENNLQTMADLAIANHVHPVFESVLPVNNYTKPIAISALRTPQNIVELNKWLQDYCAKHGYTYIDYHNAMVASNGMMRRELSYDGIHPNAAGYKVMASILKDELREGDPAR
jgi:lysophospholipase L1-like esterase